MDNFAEIFHYKKSKLVLPLSLQRVFKTAKIMNLKDDNVFLNDSNVT